MFEGYDIYALAPSQGVNSNPSSTRQGRTLTSTIKQQKMGEGNVNQ